LSSHCDGSTWADFYYGVPITRPTAASNWTTVNGGTLSDNGGTLKYTKSTSGLGVNLKAISGSDFIIGLVPIAVFSDNVGGIHECGIYLTSGTTAGTHAAHGLNITLSDSGTPQTRYLRRSYTPINGTITDEGLTESAAFSLRPIWMRLVISGSNSLAYIGDGSDWTLIHTDAIGFTPTHWGFGCDPRGTDPVVIRIVSVTP
jgi:hypothetical protein